MASMGAAYAGWLAAQESVSADGRYLPDDGVCPVCDWLRRDHPGVEKVLAIRGLKYFDPDKGRMVIKGAIPYCRCKPVATSARAA